MRIVPVVVHNFKFVKIYVVMNEFNNLEAILSCFHGWGLRVCSQIWSKHSLDNELFDNLLFTSRYWGALLGAVKLRVQKVTGCKNNSKFLALWKCTRSNKVLTVPVDSHCSYLCNYTSSSCKYQKEDHVTACLLLVTICLLCRAF